MDTTIQPEQVECLLEHFFSDGVYVRQITMPGGSFVVGKEHLTRHLNVIISGRVLMYDQFTEEIFVIQGPCTFESEPGVSKTLYIHSDTIWQTVHANVNNEQDTAKLESILVVEPLIEEDYMPALETFKQLIESQPCHS